MKKRIYQYISMVILCCLLCESVVSADTESSGTYAEEQKEDVIISDEETEYSWTLQNGNTFSLPVKGEVLEYSSEILSLQEDGSFAVTASGEGELIVRYRIQTLDVPQETVETETEETPADIENNDLIQTVPEDEKAPITSEETLPSMESEPEEDAITLGYDKTYEQETVPEDFKAIIFLPIEKNVEVVSCSVNGVEESYIVEDNHLILERQSLQEGKNRVMVTVKDEDGNLTVMEPWEFTVTPSVKEENRQEKEKTGVHSEKREQKLSWGMCFLLIGTTLVYYEKKKYIEKKKEV